MASTKTKLHLLYLGIVIYGAGYLVLLWAAALGDLRGFVGVAVIIMATGLLIAGVFGALIGNILVQVLGEE